MYSSALYFKNIEYENIIKNQKNMLISNIIKLKE